MIDQHCKKCGSTRPVKFDGSNPRPDGSTIHVKASYGCCGMLIGWVYMTDVPYFKESGARILTLTKDLSFIENQKLKMNFDATKQGLQKNIEYANLYLQIINSAFT